MKLNRVKLNDFTAGISKPAWLSLYVVLNMCVFFLFPQVLSVLNRAQIIDDAFSLARWGKKKHLKQDILQFLGLP